MCINLNIAIDTHHHRSMGPMRASTIFGHDRQKIDVGIESEVYLPGLSGKAKIKSAMSRK